MPTYFSLRYAEISANLILDETQADVPHMQKQGMRFAVPLRKPGTGPQTLGDEERRIEMIKLYRDAQRPNNLVAYIANTGWVMFPAKENGWERRAPARGLDPLYLREIPLHQGFGAGVPQPELLKAA